MLAPTVHFVGKAPFWARAGSAVYSARKDYTFE